MTLIILAVDALDADLVDHFEIDAFRLESSKQIETFAHARNQPYTPEVWTTVATGLPATQHGVTGSGTSEWSNPFLEFASHISSHFSEHTRGKLGRFVRRTTGERERIGQTSVPTIFDNDGAVVRNWPGVTDGSDLQYAWDLMCEVSQDMSKREFERSLLGLCAEQFGWAREMLNHDVTLAGVHIHTLDAAGHAYCQNESSLKRMYERVGEFVTEVDEQLGSDDELLLLSDHGIAVSFYEEDQEKNPGSHSWRAYASATTDDIPESVFDVMSWVDRHIESPSTETKESIDMPLEQLRELGYLE